MIVPRGRGVRGAATALSGPRHPSASHRAGPGRIGWIIVCDQMKDMLMSFNCRWDRGDAVDDCLSLFLPGFRESALRASRATVGAPLQAAGGRATAVKLQTNGRANVKMMIDLAGNFASISPSFIILSGFETTPF